MSTIGKFIRAWRLKHKPVNYPLATNQEVLAVEICQKLGHLSDHAKDEILKIVVSRTLPKKCLGYRPYQRNPKQKQQAEIVQ